MKTALKIYLFVMVALYVYGFQLIDSSYGVRAYFNLLIDTISLIAIFEYVKNKNIFKKNNLENLFTYIAILAHTKFSL